MDKLIEFEDVEDEVADFTSKKSKRVLSKYWTVDWRLTPFFSERKIVYFEKLNVLVSATNDALVLVDVESAQIITKIDYLEDKFEAFNLSDDGSILVSSCHSTLIRLWELTVTGEAAEINTSLKSKVDWVREHLNIIPKKIWKGSQKVVKKIAVKRKDSNSVWIATGSVDGSLQVFNGIEGFRVHKFEKADSEITALCFHPNKEILICGYMDGDIRLFDLYRECCVALLKDHISTVTDIHVIFSKDLFLGGLASSSRDSVINVWSLDMLSSKMRDSFTESIASLVVLDNFPVEAEPITPGCDFTNFEIAFMTFINNSTKSGKRRKKRKTIFESKEDAESDASNILDNKKLLAEFWQKEFQDPILLHPQCQIPTQKTIYSVRCVSSKILRRCNVEDTKELGKIKELCEICAWVLLSGDSDGNISIWNPVSCKRIASIETIHKESIIWLEVFTKITGSEKMMCFSEDCVLTIWHLPSLTLSRTLIGGFSETIHCQFIPANCLRYNRAKQKHATGDQQEFDRILILGSDKNCAIAYRNQKETNIELLIGHQDTVLCADVSADGCWAFTGAKDGTARVWSLQQKKTVAVLSGHVSPVTSIQASKKLVNAAQCSCTIESSSGRDKGACELFVVTFCSDNVMKLWKLSIGTFSKLFDAVSSEKQFYAEEPTLLSRDGICGNKILNENPFLITTALASALAHTDVINAVDMSPNDKLLATGSNDKTIKLWNLPVLSCRGICRGHTKGVRVVRFSRDKKILASGSGDFTIKLWNVADFTCLKTLTGHLSSVMGVEFITLSTQLLSCSAHGLIKLFNIRSSESVSTFNEHDSKKIWCLRINNKDNRMVTCGSNNHVILWKDVSSEREKENHEKARLEKQRIENIDSLVYQGDPIEALKLTVQYRRPKHFEQILTKGYQERLFRDFELTLEKKRYDCLTKLIGAINPLTFSGMKSILESIDDNSLKNLYIFLCLWFRSSSSLDFANTLLRLLLKILPAERLIQVEGFNNLVNTFSLYYYRHSNRLESMIQRTFILDIIFYTNRNSDIVIPSLLDKGADKSIPVQSVDSLNPLSTNEVFNVLFGHI